MQGKRFDFKKTIAIVGAGISGITCAHILQQHADVTLFEANNYVGGHTNTIRVPNGDQQHAIDSGFIVFNKCNYPMFLKFINQLDVEYQDSEMSFSFSSEQHNLEYSGHKLKTLFSQRSNLLRPRFYFLLNDILRYQKDAQHFLSNGFCDDLSIKTFVEQQNYTPWFWDVYLCPMASAIWSSSPHIVEQMPAKLILRFFDNHGLLNYSEMPTWQTIKGGSQTYVRQFLQRFTGRVELQNPAIKIQRHNGKIRINTVQQSDTFDQVILACHSDTALQLLDDTTDDELAVLGSIPYQENKVVLHTDPNVMPKRRKTWASWNYIDDAVQIPTLTYYMNRLQALDIDQDYFVTVNTSKKINPNKIIQSFNYSHPMITQRAVNAQQEFELISGIHNTYFCGAYWFNGFHEDGVASAVRVCEQLGVSF